MAEVNMEGRAEYGLASLVVLLALFWWLGRAPEPKYEIGETVLYAGGPATIQDRQLRGRTWWYYIIVQFGVPIWLPENQIWRSLGV